MPGLFGCGLIAAVALIFGDPFSAYAADRTVVALITGQRSEMPWIDVAEAALLSDDRITLVDREHLEQVLKEHQLTALTGPADGAARTRVGKLLGCDLLIVVRNEAKPQDVVRVTIADTRTGIRLVNSVLPARLVTETRRLPQELLATALNKRAIADPIVLAIPPFANDDLSRSNGYLQSSLAIVCEVAASHYPRLLLVELDEARELAKENALTGAEVTRPRAHYLVGRFRLEADNQQRPPFVSLKLERGDVLVAEKKHESPTPATVGDFVQQASAALLESLEGHAATEANSTADAEKLAQQSLGFLQISAFEEGYRLAEASLLLRPDQPDLRHTLAGIYFKHAYDQYDADPTIDKERFDRQFYRAISLSKRGLEHLQIHVETSKLEFRKYYGTGASLVSFLIHRHADAQVRSTYLKHNRDIRDMYAEVLLARARRDDLDSMAISKLLYSALGYFNVKEEKTLEQFLTDRLRLLPIAAQLSPKLRGSVYREILTFGVPKSMPEAVPYYQSLLDGPDSELVDAAKYALADIDRLNKLAIANRGKLRPPVQRSAAPAEGDSDTFVRATPVDIRDGKEKIELQGTLSDTHGHEVAWGDYGRLVVLHRTDGGPYQRIFQADNRHKFANGCFDGKYFWIPVSGAGAELLRIDPASGAIVKINAEHGLPKVDFVIAVTAPLEPGRIVLVACFGPQFARRSFVAEVVCPQDAAPRVRVVHESRDEVIETDFQKRMDGRKTNTATAYVPKFVLPLRDKPDSPPTRVLIGRALCGGGAGEEYSLVVDLPTGQATVSAATVQSHLGTRSFAFHEDAAYWLAGHKVWRISAEKPDVREAVADVAVESGALHFAESGILIIGYECWFATSWSNPFQRIPSGQIKFHDPFLHKLNYSSHDGTLLTAGQVLPKTYRLEVLTKTDSAK